MVFLFSFFFFTVRLVIPKNHLPQGHLTPPLNYQFLPLDLGELEGVKQRAWGMGDGALGYLFAGGQGHWDLHGQTGHT